MKPPSAPPPLAIDLGGHRLPEDVQGRLAEIRVQQRLSMPSLCELVFLDGDARLADSGFVACGDTLVVRVAPASRPLFEGEVTGLDYAYTSRGSEVRVRAYDSLNPLARRRSVRSFVRASLADITRQLVVDLAIDVADVADDSPWDRVIQHRQSDLQLLAELAERRGRYIVVADGVLAFVPLEGRGEPLVLQLGENLLEASIGRNELHRRDSVQARGWDTWSGALRAASADGSGEASAATASCLDLILNQAVRTDNDARSLAQAGLDFREAERATLTAVAKGDPQLVPGARVRIEGVAHAARGTYGLTAVNHVIHPAAGYLAELSSTPMRPPQRAAGVGATLGVVTRTDDPERLGRIQIALPAFGDVGSDWVQVVSPWAGAGKGMAALPDVDDTVLFLYFDADLAHGVVLGSLYGTRGPPTDWSKEGAGQCYTFITPGGQKIVLNDAHGTARIASRDGSFVELTPGGALLHARGALRIEAPGSPIVIRGRSIDLQRG